MLHSGHVAFFEEAASYGDLYVGLGSDQTIWGLKGHKTINNESERLYMVKSIRYVKDAWINSGSGLMDFEKEILELKPDIFFVNSDGFTTGKEQFCKEHGIELIVSKRIPHAGLPARSTTSLRQKCLIPYRVELCGGWMDQPFINSVCPGPVITISIYPDYEFNDRSGMATSSRKKAIELWKTNIPLGNPEKLAKLLFALDNPPGTPHISGSQDQLGIVMPGLNKLNYDNGYWPVSIDTVVDTKILQYVEKHLYLVQLPPRQNIYNVFVDKNINEKSIRRLSESTQKAWDCIMKKDTHGWGYHTAQCLEAQLEMFPYMITPEAQQVIEQYKNTAYGWKLTGAGGGGYLILISDKAIPNAIKVSIRR